MAVSPQSFGSKHTQIKLDTVAKYLNAFVTALKYQKFRKIYVDAFAGSGASTPRVKDKRQLGLNLEEASLIIDGSTRRALQVSPAFGEYIFIEMLAKNVRSLAEMVDEFPERKADVNIVRGDASAELLKFARYLATQNARSVVFLDPFGLSIKWEAIVALAETKKVDLWFLVPVGAMSRQVKNDGRILDQSEQCIDDLWGSTSWRSIAVAPADTSNDLFGAIDPTVTKIAKAKEFSDGFRKRLASVFLGGVAENVLPLGARGNHEFSLMFACSNPAASDVALRLANAVLKQ